MVIGGYLGAGKTTLVNQLLRNAQGRRIAVLVNDFGELPIDADLIEGASGEVLALSGGCICCSIGADLVGTVQRIAARDPRPDIMLIETSGVGLPASVARTARLAREIRVEGIAVVVDAQDVQQRVRDRFVGDTVRQQMAEADLLLLSKTDLLEEAQRDAVHAWIQGQAPASRLLATAGLPAEALLGLQSAPARASVLADFRPRGPIRPVEPAAARFESESILLPGSVDVQRLGRLLAEPARGVVRAKGWVREPSGRVLEFHAVGPRWSTVPGGSALEGGARLVVLRLRASPPLAPAVVALFTDESHH